MTKKKIGFLIFARSSSLRLPNKVLKKINSKPILWYIYKRVSLISKSKKNIIIVTSNKNSDDKIINFCEKNNIKFFRGSLNNVMKRSLNCAKFFKLDYFMRICADRPFLDYVIGQKMLKLPFYKYDLVTNNLLKTFPKGQTSEIVKVSTLNKINRKRLKKSNREHICDYFYENNKIFKIYNIKSNYSKKIINLNLSLDTKSDLIRIQRCFRNFKYNPIVKTNNVIKYFLKSKDIISGI